MNVDIQTRKIIVGGKEAQSEDVGDGVMWFRTRSHGSGVGLSMGIVERMRWEEGKGGYVWGKEREVRVDQWRRWRNLEEVKGGNGRNMDVIFWLRGLY